ncbi:reverse transcriptase domain-containing protein [Noviherbaspirillum sp.]|uniref:reverse transcriptase domain-containing protein n=1 Tax=Noviherbaspirillum sp. TaxID=1926288 RepID=UPI002FDFE9E6
MTASKSFKTIFLTKNLRKIYVDRIQNTASRGLDRIFPGALIKVLADELALIERKVHAAEYRYTPYKEKLISKGANEPPRLISIPTARDRIVLRGICDLLTKTYPDAIPEIPQIKIEGLKEALDSGQYCEFVRIDLQKFYPSIPHDKLIKTLKSRIRKPQILTLIHGAITNPTVPESKGGKGAVKNLCGIPQGLSISNVLAEIFLKNFDKQMREKSGIWYSRYVDDILVLCESGQSKLIAEEACKCLETYGLKPHRLDTPGSKSKNGTLTDKFEFLGYQVNGGQISIRKPSIYKLEGALAKICTAYRHKLLQAKKPEEADRAAQMCEWRLNLRITGCIFGGKRLGWMFYFSQVNETSCIRGVDNTVNRLIERFSLTGKIRPKRLLKTYYESQRTEKSDHRYIPNFDDMEVDEQRRILGMMLGEAKVKGLTDKRVKELFKMKISSAVKELEEDLAGVY